MRPATSRPGAEKLAQLRGPLADPGRIPLQQDSHVHRISRGRPGLISTAVGATWLPAAAATIRRASAGPATSTVV